MNLNFERLMAKALSLTRAGSLRGATAAIQSALRGGRAAAPVNDGDTAVIDVQAREVPRAAETAQPVLSPTPAPTPARSGQFIVGSHTEAGGTREYKLFIPDGDASRTRALVVMLHGCTQNPDDFAAGTGMNQAALDGDFLVLYPAQAQGANVARCWNWFKHNHQERGRGEPALIAGMTREVIERQNIDPARVYVAGLSAGGAMAAILGRSYPELFAAVGVHSGLAVGAANDLASAMQAMKLGAAAAAVPGQAPPSPPTIVFHGDADATVHPGNGEQVVKASLGAAPATPEQERGRCAQGREYTRQLYRNSAGKVVAEHWVLHGAGHAWSGGDARGSYADPLGPDATAAMLRFFWAQARNEAQA